MGGRAVNNRAEQRLANIPSLPAFERLAPSPPAGDLLAQVEALSKAGEVVLDLNGRGGWVARAAIAAQRRAGDFESFPLTRLLAEVVVRPPDVRQLDAAVLEIGAASMSGSTVRRTIDAMYASCCQTCGRTVILDSLVWEEVGTAAKDAGQLPPARGTTRTAGKAAGKAAGKPVTIAPAKSPVKPATRAASASRASVTGPVPGYVPGQVAGPAIRAVKREYRCAHCKDQLGGPDLRQAEPEQGDLKLAASVDLDGAVRVALSRRFPAPRPNHPLVDQLLSLHSPRQLLGLNAILAAIDAEKAPPPLAAALRLAFLHAITTSSRLNLARGKQASLRIANGSLRLPSDHRWRERNPWLAFEDGIKLVRGFVQHLDDGSSRAVQARLGPDLASLEEGTANVTLTDSTNNSMRRIGLHGDRMAPSAQGSRVRLVLGQTPLRWTPERLAATYQGTAWIFGAGAASLLPWQALFKSTARLNAVPESDFVARSLGRSLAIASPALAQNGRAVVLLDGGTPEALVAAALGGAAAGCRLIEARQHRGDDSSPGIVVFVPSTGVMDPGPRTRANRPLPPVEGGVGHPGTIVGRGVFGAPEKLDDGPFRPGLAAQVVTETTVELLKSRGEPASFEQLLGDLLVGLDQAGQLARLARVYRPARAADGWDAWVEMDPADPGDPADPADPDSGAPAAGNRPAVTGNVPPTGTPTGVGGHAAGPVAADSDVADQAPSGERDDSPVAQLLRVIHEELDRPNNRRLRQIEPGYYWLVADDDRAGIAQPLADRVEWSVFSLLSSAGHLTADAAIERTQGMFGGSDVPALSLIEACLASYSGPTSTPEAVVCGDQLEARSREHDAAIATLAEIGHLLGMQVWIGKRQQLRLVGGRPLSSWLDEAEREIHLPLITWAPEGELDRVDCAWYVRRKAALLFEVEWTAMLGEPVLVHHGRYPSDEKVVRFLVIPPERAELVRLKLARSALLRKSFGDRNWHVLKWNHLAALAAREELTLADLEPYLGLDAAADIPGEQMPMFEG